MLVGRTTHIRVVYPELSATFAVHHDASLRRCLSRLLGVDPSSVYCDLASLPLSLGGLWLRSATLTSRPASGQVGRTVWEWSSTDSSVSPCRARFDEHHPAFHLEGVRLSGAHLAAAGFEAPSWLADGIRPHQIVVEVDREPGVPRHGWQRAPPQSQSTVCKWRAVSVHDSLPLNKRCSDFKDARCRVFRSRASQRRPCLGLVLPLSVCCFSGASGSLSHLPLASAGAAVSSMSLATTEEAGVLGRRGFALESAPLACVVKLARG